MGRSLRVLMTVVLATLLAAIPAAAAPPDDVGGPAQAADYPQRMRPAPINVLPTNAVIISDSAMAGVRWNGALDGFRGFNADHRLESCRRLVASSCRGREGYRPRTVFEEIWMLPSPGPSDVLIIATGYNDWSGRFATDVATILGAGRARGFTTIAWVNYRDEVTYTLPGTGVQSNYGLMNAELDLLEASGQYPELIVWDFDEYTSRTVGWFAPDGVHETRLGSWGVADWISRHIAHLDNKPCPMPWNSIEQMPLVCPDPDPMPPAVGYPELYWLYPV